MRQVYFVIDSEPCGKGRPRFTKNGHCYTPGKTTDYEQLVVDSYRAAGHARYLPHSGPVVCDIKAIFAMPKNHTRGVHECGFPCFKRPDCDNIAKIVLDALNGIAYADDSQVSCLTVSKEWSERGFVAVTFTFFD